MPEIKSETAHPTATDSSHIIRCTKLLRTEKTVRETTDQRKENYITSYWHEFKYEKKFGTTEIELSRKG
jgi:hypothetical protein